MPTSKNKKKSKTSKEKIEEQKLKYKENQTDRAYKLKLAELKTNLKMEELENVRSTNDIQQRIKEKQIELDTLKSDHEHEEKVIELYNEFIKIIIAPMTEFAKEQINALKDVRQENIRLLQNSIDSTKDDIKKLEEETKTAIENGETSLFSENRRQIRKKQKDVDLKEAELADFIKTSWNDLNELTHRGIPLPSPSEFINNSNGLIANQRTCLIEEK